MIRTISPRGNARQSKRSRTDRRALTRRPRFTRYRSVANFGKAPFPASLSSTLKYTEIIQITNSVTGHQYNAFNASSMYDPNESIGGFQPRYFDQLMAIYNHFTVTKSRITVSLENVDVATAASTFGVFLDDDKFPNCSAQRDYLERPGCNYTTSVPNRTGSKTSVGKVYDAYKVFGPGVLNNALHRGSATNNPTEGQHFIVFTVGGVGVVTTLIVTIEYTATFSELKSIESS